MVKLGLTHQLDDAAPPAPNKPTYASAAAHQPRQPPQTNRLITRAPDHEVHVIGTSLIRGLGHKLFTRSVNATAHTYAGVLIPDIRSRIPHIFPRDDTAETVILQCGGNDAEKYHEDRIIDEYEGLIKDIKRQCQNATLLLNSIPPRKNDKRTLSKIKYVNEYLQDRGLRNDNVRTINVVPKMYRYFNRDRIHFNENGKHVYADNIKTVLQSFTRRQANANQ